ncbi:S8 family peptidase [Persicobacter sp. CCB-QB2]|uniref:S8 family peptidase n=1 Tax=Persicobacter sp. CCB-QB2 TaxID=1561025 RepID=UPI0009E5229C|nr:S8 family peptidase [Persicobacter sp. CCB-QB2]
MNKIFTLLLLMASTLVCNAQESRFLVRFMDKSDNEFDLNQPEEFLTEASLERRSRLGIILDENDLPLSPKYRQKVKDEGYSIWGETKWLNGLVVLADRAQESALGQLAGVTEVAYLGPHIIKNSAPEIPVSNAGSPTTELMTSLQNSFLNLDSLYELGWNAEGVRVAIFDAGFLNVPFGESWVAVHEDRIFGARNYIEPGLDVYRYHLHGTHVYSTMGYYKEGEFEGIAPEADYMFCVTEDVANEYPFEEINWLMAAEYADSLGADIIQSSLGYYDFDDPSLDYTQADLDGKTAWITQAAGIAAERGILVVNSAGNEARNYWQKISFPADHEHVLAVGAMDEKWTRSSFSSFGPNANGLIKPNVSTLGSSVALAVGEGKYVRSSGTSYASPMIAALAAMVIQEYPDKKPEEVITYLQENAHQAYAPDTLIGYGVPMNNQRPLYVLEPNGENLQVSPNPMAPNLLRLLVGEAPLMDCQLQIVGVDGKPHFAQKEDLNALSTKEVQLPAPLNSGVYFLRWATNKEQGVKKIVVQ